MVQLKSCNGEVPKNKFELKVLVSHVGESGWAGIELQVVGCIEDNSHAGHASHANEN